MGTVAATGLAVCEGWCGGHLRTTAAYDDVSPLNIATGVGISVSTCRDYRCVGIQENLV